MELILLRHGKAEDHFIRDDFNRGLVAKGIDQARRAAVLLKRMDRLPDVVLSSPRIRAKQTAEQFCDEASLEGPVIQPWLDCGMSPSSALSELVAFTEFNRVMIVGHEPDFSSLVEHAIGCSGGGVEVKKGSLVGLQVNPPSDRGWLCYSLPPKWLQNI